MAVTGAIFNSLIFGGVDSANYGIYITGEAVYNAPERAVEMVTVPGRNGAIAIDQGRWENIEVEYPAGCFGDGDANFADRISAFRNAVLSQIGYQRLTDTYHPDEYRQAIYVAGLEVEPANINSAGEFKLIFNCKPQRFLTSGETAVAVTSGGTITNPTLCDARPLLEIEGNGNVKVGDYSITLNSGVVGYVILEQNLNLLNHESKPYPAGLVGASDNLKVSGLSNTVRFDYAYLPAITNITITDSNNLITLTSEIDEDGAGGNLTLSFADYNAAKGSSLSGSGNITFTTTGGTAVWAYNYTVSFAYDNISLSLYMSATPGYACYIGNWHVNKIDCVSTGQILGTPTYIDCDIGEAYRIDAGKVTRLNRYIELGSALPTLAPGATEITYDNTVTDFKVVPRWWIL